MMDIENVIEMTDKMKKFSREVVGLFGENELSYDEACFSLSSLLGIMCTRIDDPDSLAFYIDVATEAYSHSLKMQSEN